MAKDSKQVTGYLYVLAAAVLWSLIGPFSKICMEEGLAPLEVAFWRALLGGICFFAQTGICGGARIPVKHAMFFCLFGVEHQRVFQFAANLHPVKRSRHGDGAAVYGSRMGGRILPHPVP